MSTFYKSRGFGIVVTVLIAMAFVSANSAAEEDRAGAVSEDQAGNNVSRSQWPEYDLSQGGFLLYRSEDGSRRLTFGGAIFGRYAYWNWFEGPSHGNEYSYEFQRTRLHLKYDSTNWTALIEPQYVTMWDVPDDAFKAPPEACLGMGALYYEHNDDTTPEDIGIHQAYVRLHPSGKPWQLKLGRLEYTDGMEVFEKSDGQHFNMLKTMRLGDRMISPFGWSAFGRSFDGGTVQYDNDALNVTTAFFYPTQGGWEEEVDTTIEDISIGTFTLTTKKDAFIPGMEIAGFYYNYRDDRNVSQRVDNQPAPKPSDRVDIDIDMFGGHAVGVYPVGRGQMDVLFWGGYQFGDWYELDQRAFAFAGEVGYQFTEVHAKPWLRAGYYVGSGDGDPGDGDHGTFFQMAPGTQKYNLLPYCDLMNTEDIFIQLITYPVKNMMIRADYHVLQLNEEDDLWYMGSGPTQESGDIFGYLGRPTHGSDDLSQEFDLLVNYKLRSHLTLLISYTHIFGDDVVKGVYTEDSDADYFAAALSLEF